ncbi:TonB-dependent receptor [Polymorphobacter sp.]|uniref:TonB-dependent receptor n=1 Tax=Polymorphobacter sp. TaxID=1909290 RepID=UPI003F71100D
MIDTTWVSRSMLAALLAASAAPGLAQAIAEGAAADSGEIIVTARKKEERLQDVPLTITVVGQEQITRANLDNINDLAFQTPGFSFRQGFGRTGGGGGAGVRPSVRGMSSVVGAPNAAFFVDGVFVSDNIGSYQLDNLERVEVIKGPQSALFGRQTFAGAINFVTRRPTNDLQGRLQVTLGEFKNHEVSGYLSGALVRDVLKAEINGRYYNFGGDYVNADNGKRELGAQRSFNIGTTLVFTPSDNFEAVLRLGYNNDEDGGYVYNFQGSGKNNCFPAPIVGSVPFPRTNTARRDFYCGEVQTLPSYAYNIDEIRSAGFNGLDREFYRSSLQLNYTTDEGWAFTSISAFNHNESVVGQDNTLLPSANPAFAVDQSKNRDWQQELRVATPQDWKVRALAGGYYFQQDDLGGFQFTNTNRTRRPFDSNQGVRSYALFGMVEADVTERLTISAEGRYQWETIRDSSRTLGVEGQPAPVPTGLREAKFKAFLPRATIAYEVSSALNLFATAAKGNKPGGFNALPNDGIAADNQFFRDQGFDVFREESAWSYEVGAKGRVGAINVSVAGFYIDWSNQQLSRGEAYTRTNGTPNSVVFIQNAGKSEIKGFEVDVSGNPTPWLFLRGAYTFVDARFKEFYDDTTEEIYDTDGRPGRLRGGARNPLDLDKLEGDVSGNRLPQTPQHQFVLTGQIQAPVSDGLSGFLRGDLAYESKRYSQVDNLNWAGDSYNLNVNVGLEGKNWNVTLFARNLLDDKTPLVVTRLLDFNRLLTRVNPLTGLNQTTFFRDFAVSAPRRRQFGVVLGTQF